ncbi:alpha/beta hydrolase [Brasilonema bromeliae]|uniref:Alpha/beta hydrolase n=1 Tax=Brasilonema bromeliae SPC951 TaxID=385972 RepID=A0ABX1PBC4_9CYAN|nr:alpha/beta hydrolase [Brasilonema bromeliae]NMG20825.1 alpha/beta hydrolase [Brasilonema bromeliae SPC951]
MQSNLRLDWKIRLLDWLLRLNKPLDQLSLDELRKLSETPIPFVVERLMGGKRIRVLSVINQIVEGRHGEIPIRLYYPSSKQNLPLILFFHGGGWVFGNFQTYDLMCRRIAHSTSAIVIAVGYRLAPWFKYPTAVEDCYDILTWAVKNATNLGANNQQVIVMGDSAGGNLATSVCLMARDQGQRLIARQILVYPVTDGTLSQPSIEVYANAPVLTKDLMQCFVKYYARTEADRFEPYFSPMLAENLSYLPPALIITAEYDPLHDEGQKYAQRLHSAGNQVRLIDYSGMVHGFLSFPPFCPEALPAFAEIAAYVGALSN